MNKKINFTQGQIKKLRLPEKGTSDYHDAKVAGLICRVSSSGNKSFLVSKRVNRKLITVTIGKSETFAVDDARRAALKHLSSINSGVNPNDAKRKKQLEMTTLLETLEQYLDSRDLKHSTVQDYRNKLRIGFPDWLNKPVTAISENMVIRKFKLISKNGKTSANNKARVLRLTLGFAVVTKMIDSNPVRILSTARLWHKSMRKNQIIKKDQLKSWHEAVESLPNLKAQVYLLIGLYMGLRRAEILKLQWANVDFKGMTITALDTKSRNDFVQPIPKLLLKYLKSLEQITGHSKWMFSSQDPDRPISIPAKAIKSVSEVSGVSFSTHDLRRTFATIAEAVNLPMSMIKRLMNHATTNDVTGGYIITEQETLRVAINKVANYIQANVTEKNNVMQLHANK